MTFNSYSTVGSALTIGGTLLRSINQKELQEKLDSLEKVDG